MTVDPKFAPQRGELPHAGHNPVSAPFWEGCAAGELRYQRCPHCATANFPPSEHCRQCVSLDLQWEVSRGRGLLYSWTVVHRPASPVFVTPYVPAIVVLDEGYSMLTNLIGVTERRLRVDLPMKVEIHHVGDELWLPYFRPVRT